MSRRYDAEQEQIENIKRLWNKYGTHALSVLLVIAVAFAGWRYWQNYTYTQAANASAIFEFLEVSHQQGKFGEVSREALKLMQEQPNSPYSASASMLLSQFHWENDEKAEAEEKLNWVLEQKQTNEIKLVAALRLVRLALENKDFAKADAYVAQAQSFATTSADKASIRFVQAELALVQENLAEAYEKFKSVVEDLSASGSLQNLAKIYMDDLTPQ